MGRYKIKIVCGCWYGVCSYMVQYSYNNNNFKILWCLYIVYEFLWPSTGLIPIHLEDNHWVVARVDFRRKQISIYDSMKEFREDKTYGQILKPLQVIFPQWLEDVGFYSIQPNLRSVEPWKLMSVDDVPQQQPQSSDCGCLC